MLPCYRSEPVLRNVKLACLHAPQGLPGRVSPTSRIPLPPGSVRADSGGSGLHLGLAYLPGRARGHAAEYAVREHLASGASASVSFVQGTAFSTAKVTSTTVSMSHSPCVGGRPAGRPVCPVRRDRRRTRVSNNVNGAWTRAPSSEQFNDGQGDIALCCCSWPARRPPPAECKSPCRRLLAAYLQGTVAEYSGIAATGPRWLAWRWPRASSSAVNSGATSSVPAGAAGLRGRGDRRLAQARCRPRAAAPGSPYTERASTSSGSAFEEDITSGAAGAKAGTATPVVKSTDWYAVVACLAPASTTPSPRPPPVRAPTEPRPSRRQPDPDRRPG